MNLKDIIDLAKAGYKPNDVKELIELADAHEQRQNEERKEEPEVERKEEPEVEKKEEPEVDDTKEQEIENLKTQVKKLQDENTRKDVSPDIKSDADILADFVRGFM